METGPNGGSPQWSAGPLLGPGTGLTPPFGANGVEFSNDHKTLYVADTAYHQIIQIPVNADGTAGTPSILITGINAPDGIMVDRKGNIWICSNQEDEIVVIDPDAKPNAKVIAKLGDFYGIDRNGIAQGFLFPASLAFSNDGSNSLRIEPDIVLAVCAGADPWRSTRIGRSRSKATRCPSFLRSFLRSPLSLGTNQSDRQNEKGLR